MGKKYTPEADIAEGIARHAPRTFISRGTKQMLESGFEPTGMY